MFNPEKNENCSSEIGLQNIYQGKSKTYKNIHQNLVPETVPRPKILDPFSTPQKNHQDFQTPPIKINICISQKNR